MISSSSRPVSAMPDRLRIGDDGTAVLLGTRCVECGASFAGAVRFCRRCTSDRLEPVELSGTGTLFSSTIVRRAAADWAGPVPYALVEVALPEGVLVASRVSDWAEDEPLRVGEPMQVVAIPAETTADGTETAVYAWRRTGGSDGR